jgi:hypothetical protein
MESIRLNNSINIFKKMTDDNKELIFNNITRWLRESNFVIREERVTVVTSEFYAKAYIQAENKLFLEIISYGGIDTRFVLQTRLCISEQQINILENLDPNEKQTLDDKMNNVISPLRQSITIRDKSVLLDKTISIDPKSVDAKQEVIHSVLSLLESAKRLEIIFMNFFQTRGDNK